MLYWWSRWESNPGPHLLRLRAVNRRVDTVPTPCFQRAWWRRRELNPEKLACRASAFPLGYAPTSILVAAPGHDPGTS